jgi:hypothetical protein
MIHLIDFLNEEKIQVPNQIQKKKKKNALRITHKNHNKKSEG